MTEDDKDEIKYLIFLAIKAERERIVNALCGVGMTYGFYDHDPDYDQFIRDIRSAINGDK